MTNLTTTFSLLFAILVALPGYAQDDEKITFEDHIKPVFRARCASCHNPNKKSGDLDVTNYTALMLGGGSGEVITPGDSLDSFLYGVVSYEDSPEMPPGQQLPDAQLELIKKWIDGGALENINSEPVAARPKVGMAAGESAMTRPETIPMPGRMPLEPPRTFQRRGAATAMASSPWAPLVAIAVPGQIVLYNTSDLQLTGILTLPEEEGRMTAAHSMRFSRNGSLLVAGVGRPGASGKVIIWDVMSGEVLTTLGDELDSILAIDISPDQSMIAIGGPDRLVKVYSTDSGETVYQIKKHTDWVTAIEFSPDGTYLASGDRNGGLHMWLADEGDEHQTLNGHTGAVTGISWRHDATVIASISEDATARVWNAESGEQLKNWNAHGNGGSSIEFNRDGNLITSGRDGLAKLWQPDGKAICQVEKMPDIALLGRFCDQTSRILCADWAGNVIVFDATDGKRKGELATNPPNLQTRLETSRQIANRAEQELGPVEAEFNELEKKLVALAQTTTTLVAEKDAAVNAMTELQMEVKTTEEKLASTSAKRDQWRGELQQARQAIPLVQQSHGKAVEASTALPDDVELKQSVEKLGAKVNQLEARKEELKQLVKQSEQTRQQTGEMLTQKQTVLNALKTESQDRDRRISEMETETGTLKDRLAELTKAVETARSKFAAAQREVVRWQNEIAFIEQLKQLQQKLQAANSVVADKTVVAGQAEEKLNAARSVHETAKNDENHARAAADAIEQQIRELKQKNN